MTQHLISGHSEKKYVKVTCTVQAAGRSCRRMGSIVRKYRIQTRLRIVDTGEEQDEGEPDREDTDDGTLDGEEPRDDEYSSNEFQQPDAQHKVSGRRGPIGKTNCRVVT